MPYPIPDNLDNIEGWRWYLVPLPDDDQMIQVAWGMWSELTHFWNWGKEGPVPEQSEKAAQLWAAALYEAWRIRDMGFPDLILTYIDEVEGLLRQIRDVGCCGPQDPTEGQFYTDAISDGVGDVPQNIVDAGFATDSTDWTGFDAYKCMIAHVIIDDAREKLTRLANLYDDEGLDFIGGAGAAAAILGFIFANLATGGAALVAGIIGAAGAAAALYDWLNGVGSSVLTGISSNLDANRDEIACAIFQADGPTAALSAFYSSVGANIGGIAETAVRLLNMGAVVRALYSGRYDQQNVAQALADAGFSPGGYECCQEPADIDITYTFDANTDFVIGTNLSWQSAEGGFIRITWTSSTSGFARISREAIRAKYGQSIAGPMYRLIELSLDYRTQGEGTFLELRTDGVLQDILPAAATWTSATFELPSVVDFNLSNNGVYIALGTHGTGSSGRVDIDNIRVRLIDVS